MKISVVIPVYNRSRIISKTLDSLCQQTLKDFEVIIVDDCSIDSEDLCKVLEYYENRLNISYFRHDINRYGSAARNTGIVNSKGKYVAFLDSDDIWLPGKLEACINYISDKPENTIVYSKVRDRGKVYPARGIRCYERVDEYLICNRGTMQTSSLFMLTQFAQRILFDEELKRFQDYDFIIRAQKLNKANFYFIDELLVEMTDFDLGGRISNSTDYKPAIDWVEKNSHIMTNKSKSVFAFNRIANYCVQSGKKKHAMKYIIKYQSYKEILHLDHKVTLKLLLPNVVFNFLKKFRLYA
ncbi:glycosyltransferase family 2 protein [Vibrio parahaemolyticus]|nr:glycosyltransferase family 2 protein [Vibrio parahaemolyticus]EMC8465103.1 glycosyltransferase family 2 protein [Vibrio alginolyticus]EJE8512819.1 glycosyltransferase family 2 protein [Vibrio parahaemolyticus]EJE8772762.1 glycosyltransferase family 2 protein [Vibrio parahaemolyticus]EJG1633344.1 glycosyltransferase family 2 protein [Vibrio parahaemolyticus]